MTEVKKYYYPLILKNKRLQSFRISPDIEIRRITREERREFFGLEKIIFSFCDDYLQEHIRLSKFMPSKRKNGRMPYTQLIHGGIFGRFAISDILASNYVLVISSQHSPDFLVDKINIALALCRPTSSGAYIGFRENESDVGLHYNMRIGGPFDYLHLTRKDLQKIKKIYELIEDTWGDKKFRLYSELYMKSIEGGKLSIDLRFLLLMIALEALYLQDKNAELTFRLKLKIAKIMGSRLESPISIYNKMNEMYEIRSRLVHEGKAEGLTRAEYCELTEILRKSLLRYLKNKELFSKKDEEVMLDI